MKQFFQLSFYITLFLVFFFTDGLMAQCDPEVSFNQNSIDACIGGSVTLTPILTGVPGNITPTYSWEHNPPGQGNTYTIQGASSSSYTINPITNNSNGSYIVTIDFPSGNGCGGSVNANIDVNIINPSINAGNNQTICQNQAVSLNSSVSGLGQNPVGVTYSWTSNPAGFNSTEANPQFSNLPIGQTTFTVTATYNGCAFSDNVQVFVNPNPTIPTFSIPNSGCPGIAIPVSGFTPVNGITYTWNPTQGTTVTGANSSTPNIIFNSGGTYNVSVTATNSNGCTSSSSVQSINITNLQVLDPYVEVAGVSLTPSVYNNTTTYSLCGGASGGSNSFIYNTFPNGSLTQYSISAGAPPVVSPMVNGTPEELVLNIGNNYFTITGVLNGCTVSETFNIYAGSNPYVAGGVSNSVGLCTGQTVNFSISTINPSTNTPNAAGTTYTIGVSDVPSSLPPYLGNSPFATFLDINGNQNVPYTFNSSSCNQFPPGYPANTFYAVIQASNACGTTTSSVSPIVVSGAPTANFNVSTTTACINSLVTITNAGVSGNAITGPNNNAPFSCLNTGGFYYTISPSTGWTVSTGTLGAPGVPVSNWNGITPASNTVNVLFNTPGNYTITQRYQNGCGISTFQRTVCVVSPPSCSFTVDPMSSCTPLVTSITNNTTGPSCGNTPLALAYSWSVTNPIGGSSSIATATAVNPTITLNNNTVAPNLAALNFPITLVVNPLIPGTSTPVSNCSSTCNQTVTVYPQPSFITQPVQPTTVCLDGTFNALSVTVSYLGPGLPSYQWYSNINPVSSGGILIPGATASSYVPPATAVGTIYYYCVVTFPSSTLCSTITSNNVAAIVVPDPIASASPSTQTICVGGTAPNALTGNYSNGVGTPIYQWNLVGTPTQAISGATSSTYIPPAYTSTGTFNYTVTINTSGSGCTASTSPQVEVIVVPDPTVTAPLATQTLCQNAIPTSLTVTASGGTGTLLYQWYSNTVNNTTSGTAIAGANASTYTPPTNTVGTLYYYCEVTTTVSGCSVTSATSEVIVNPAPIFTTQPAASNVCVGGSTNQMCVTYTNGTGTPSYQWYSNTANSTTGGTAIPSATINCYTPSSTTAGTTYYYAVISLTGGGCSSITSNTAVVDITPPPVIATQPNSTQTICVGGSSSPLAVALQAGTGIGAFSYQWYSNTTASNSGGSIIAAATLATYTPPVFNTASTFYYYCIVTDAGNGCGTVTSQVASVVVVADPTVNAPLATQTLCQNATPTALTVTASGGTGTLLYQWYSNTVNNTTSGTAIAGANASTYTPPTATVGVVYYYCMVTTAASGCSVTSSTSEVIVNPAPIFTTQPAASNVCVGGTTNQMCVTYSNGTGTPSYQWYSNTANSTTGGTAIPSATTNCYTPSSTTAGTTYYYAVISLTGGGCSSITSNTAVVDITSVTTLSAQPTPNQTICVGGTIPLPLSVSYSGGVGTPSYQWYNSPANTPIIGATSSSYTPPTFTTIGSSGYYVVLSLPGAGCGSQTSDVGTIQVVDDPTTTISPNSTYCQNAGNVTLLSVVPSGGQGTASYQWYSNSTGGNTTGTIINGATASTYNPPVGVIGTTYYYCVITQSAANCAVNSPAAQIIVTPAPTFTTQPTATQSVCVGGATTQLNVAYSNGTGAATYQWYANSTNSYSGGTAIPGETLSSFTPPSVTSSTIYYYCIVSFAASGGCSMINSNIAEVIVLPDPTISTQPLTTQTICVGGTIPAALNVAYSGGVGIPIYQWFGGSPAASITGATNPSYTPPTFSTPGTFNYYATISLSGSGCDALTSANGVVIVIADPIVSAQPTSTQSVCQNTPTSQLSVSISGGTGSPSYQWYSNTTNSNVGGTPIFGATSNTYTPPSSNAGTQYYYCVINQTGSNCGVTSNPAAVVVNLSPIISTQPISTQQHCLNQTTNQLQVAYSDGTGTPTYQWYSNTTNSISGGTPINSATSNTYTPPSSLDGTFYYYCVITFTSGGGCPSITSNISEVIIHPYPIVTITGGETICLLESSDINFVFTPANGFYDINYTANGQSFSIDNFNGSNPIFTVTPNQTTTYVVTNIAYDQVPQCAIQPNTSIVVIVNPLPALNNSTYTYCSDVTTASLQYIPDLNSYTYNWLPNQFANYAGQINGPSSINVTLPDPAGNAPTNYYYVTSLINNATGCQALDSILVTVNPNPVGSFTLPSTGCLDTPISLSNGDATIGNYEWTIDGLLYSTSSAPQPPVFSTLGTHTIEMIAINTFGCTDTLNSTIQIYDLPVSNFVTDLNSGCAPLPVSFINQSSGSYITSYDWSFAPDTVSWAYQFSSSSLIDPPSVTYQQGNTTVNYQVILAVTNACGTVTSSQQITVLPSPIASLAVNNISVGEPTSYIWNYGNYVSYNPNLTSMYFPSDSLIQVFPIELILSNACGSDTFIDSVTVLPDNVIGGFLVSSNSGCSPLTVTFTNTSADPNYSTFWNMDDANGTSFINQNTVSYTYTSANGTVNYNPYLVVNDGCANDTVYAQITVFPNPMPVINASQFNVCAGGSIDFTAGLQTGSANGISFSWNIPGIGSSNATNATFTFPTGSFSGTSIPVSLTASSPNYTGGSCSATSNATIYVYSLPDVSGFQALNSSGCSNLLVTLSGLPNAVNTVNWGDGITNSLASHLYINNGASTETFPIQITSQNVYATSPSLICTSLTSELAIVVPLPLPEITANLVNICEGGSIDFFASTTNNQLSGVVFDWDFGGLGSSSNQSETFQFENGTYQGTTYPIVLTATQTANGFSCSNAVSTNIVVFETPDLSSLLFDNISGCSPLQVDLSNLPNAIYTIDWGDGIVSNSFSHTYFNSTNNQTNYPITVTASNVTSTVPMLTCTSITNAVASVQPQPIADFIYSMESACMPGPVNIDLQNTSINALAPFNWSYNNTDFVTNNIDYSIAFDTPGLHDITLTVANQFGCTDAVTQSVEIFDLPIVQIVPSSTELCLGEPVEFDINASNLATMEWDFGDGTTEFHLNLNTLTHYYSSEGIYSLSIIAASPEGCIDTLDFNNFVLIHPVPTASFIPSITVADITFPYFEFSNNSANANSYYWSFGDGSWSNDENTNHTYIQEGDFMVSLTAFNNYGCFDVTYEVVHVEGIVVYVPNAFTPLDYDGLNDVFIPVFSSTQGITFYELTIYNQWGTKIFETNNPDEGWMGNSNENDPGEDNYYAQNDIYVWQVKYRKRAQFGSDEPAVILTGHVTIIR
jgi:PKD repeat protein